MKREKAICPICKARVEIQGNSCCLNCHAEILTDHSLHLAMDRIKMEINQLQLKLGYFQTQIYLRTLIRADNPIALQEHDKTWGMPKKYRKKQSKSSSREFTREDAIRLLQELENSTTTTVI